MHFCMAVVLPKGVTDDGEVEKAVGRLMGPWFGWSNFDSEEPEGHKGELWDWFVIGGRFCGSIQGKPTRDENPAFDRYKNNLAKNRSAASEVLASEFRPFGFVSPDGDWVSRDDMTDAAFERKFEEVLAANPDSVVVAVDCHS